MRSRGSALRIRHAAGLYVLLEPIAVFLQLLLDHELNQQRLLIADLNCDGDVDGDDVQQFVRANFWW